MKEFIEFMQFILPFLDYPDTHSFQAEHKTLILCDVQFEKMSGEDIRKCMAYHFIPGNGDEYDNDLLNEATGRDWKNITDEAWDKIKSGCGLTRCLHSYYYGNC
jgi:hypothetical protein